MAFVNGGFGNGLLVRPHAQAAVAAAIRGTPAKVGGNQRSRALSMAVEPKTEEAIEKVVKQSPLNVNESGAGTFGFSYFAERLNGRAAMVGFVLALVGEIVTGKSLFQQMAPNMEAGSSASYVFLFVMLSLWTFTSIGYVALKKAQQIDSLTEKRSDGENF